MPQSYDYEDHRIELEAELASLRDDLTAEVKAHKRTAESRDWYKRRVDMLQRKQTRMREPERTLVCDIIANCELLPDPNGERYGKQNTSREARAVASRPECGCSAIQSKGDQK